MTTSIKVIRTITTEAVLGRRIQTTSNDVVTVNITQDPEHQLGERGTAIVARFSEIADRLIRDGWNEVQIAQYLMTVYAQLLGIDELERALSL